MKELKPGLEVRATQAIPGIANVGDYGVVTEDADAGLVVRFHLMQKAIKVEQILQSILPPNDNVFRFGVSLDVEARGPIQAYEKMRQALDATGFGWETETLAIDGMLVGDVEVQSVIEEAGDFEEECSTPGPVLRPCVDCGAQVGEREAPPYANHAPTCRLVAEWRSPSRRLRMATALEYLGDAVGSNLPLEQKIEKARMALEAGGFLEDPEVTQRRELQVNRLDVLREEREAAHAPHRFKAAGLVVDLREVVAINQQENPTCTFVYLRTGQSIWLPIPSAEIVAAWEKAQ